MSSEHPSQTTTCRLSCSEINGQNGNPVILFIHGASSSGGDWDLVTPYLNDQYHLLLPDLPGHGGSREITPFSKELSAKLLSELVSERTVDGKAHVVGFSLGAHIAIELASKYQECVETVFVSGYEVFNVSPQTFMTAGQLESHLTSIVPRGVIKWLMDGTDLPTPQAQPSQALRSAIAETMCIKDEQWPSPWPAKTLIVAAGKAGLLPTADHPHDAIRLRDIGRKMNEAPGQSRIRR